MKNYVKAVVTFVFLMAAVAIAPTVSKAAVSAPSNLKQSDAIRNAVEFSWDAVVDADAYFYEWSADGTSWSKTQYTFEPKIVIENLSAGKSYYVRVSSVKLDQTGGENDEISDWTEPFEVVTSPDAAELKVTPTSILSNSISLSWQNVSGATSYVIKDGADKVLETTTSTSVTIGNLVPNTLYTIDVFPARTSASGYQAATSYSHHTIRTASNQTVPVPQPVVVTEPGAASTANFNLYSMPSSTSNDATVSFIAKDPSGKAMGYEIEVFKVKGNKKVKTVSSTSTISSRVKLSKNVPYKYRMRYFVQTGGQKKYGSYSGFRYFCMQKISGKKYYNTRSTACKIKMKWSKVAGASGYTVYVSKSATKGFKKVKTLGKNAKSVTFNKIGKSKMNKNTTYYVKVVANVKDGKKTVGNDAQRIHRTY